MKLKNYLKKELIFYDLAVVDREDFFAKVSEKTFSLGYVNEEFQVNVIKREETFPTGLQLEDFAIAIPHTDAEYVKKEFIAVSLLKNTVQFNSMEDANQSVDVKVAFVLGLNQPHNQLEVLTELMNLFQNKEFMEKVIHSKSKEELENLIFNI